MLGCVFGFLTTLRCSRPIVSHGFVIFLRTERECVIDLVSLNDMADCFCVYACVFLSYHALVEAARAGRGGAGRFSRMRSGQLTGRRPVHWREKTRGKMEQCVRDIWI